EESEAPAEPGEFDFTDFGLEEESAASLADTQVESEVGFDLDFDLDADELQENPDQALDAALTDLAAAEPQEPAVIEPAPLDDFELNLDDELQADNLLAEFEAMSLAGADNESAAPAAGEKEDDFTLTDEDLAGFEAELQAVMGNAAAAQQDDQPLAGSDLANGFGGDAMAADGLGDDDDFDFLADTDECATKLDLARAYIDMGDEEGARDILAEVVEEGNQQQ